MILWVPSRKVNWYFTRRKLALLAHSLNVNPASGDRHALLRLHSQSVSRNVYSVLPLIHDTVPARLQDCKCLLCHTGIPVQLVSACLPTAFPQLYWYAYNIAPACLQDGTLAFPTGYPDTYLYPLFHTDMLVIITLITRIPTGQRWPFIIVSAVASIRVVCQYSMDVSHPCSHGCLNRMLIMDHHYYYSIPEVSPMAASVV